jgi:hypothetical protein
MATVSTTIKDLIGDDTGSTLIPSFEDLIRAGFNYVADLIPATSEMWNSHNLDKATADDSDSGFGFTSTTRLRKIIKVTRTNAGDIEREALEISYKDYLKGADPTSIFYHGRSTTLPVYTFKPDGNLVISPEIGSGDSRTIYYFDYITVSISNINSLQLHLGKDSSDTTVAGGEAGKGFPELAFYVGCIKSALNLLQAKISDAAQDDEDMELVQILQAQKANLEKEFQSELQRLQIPYKVVGVPDDIK